MMILHTKTVEMKIQGISYIIQLMESSKSDSSPLLDIPLPFGCLKEPD